MHVAVAMFPFPKTHQWEGYPFVLCKPRMYSNNNRGPEMAAAALDPGDGTVGTNPLDVSYQNHKMQQRLERNTGIGRKFHFKEERYRGPGSDGAIGIVLLAVTVAVVLTAKDARPCVVHDEAARDHGGNDGTHEPGQNPVGTVGDGVG